ncbi:MAG: protoheme IX farnesyltransferase [Leptospiraceae bacterium]|nr:MAG: protoheme IX farnesyltransferase [Leptospiraceae bacterium]
MDKNKIKSYYQLFKPGLALNIVITEIPVFLYHKIDSFELIFYTTIGTLLCAMSSFAYNQIIEQNRDKLMKRTQHRYLVQYEVNPFKIYYVASLLIGVGSFILGFYVGILPMIFALFAFFNYVFIYTIWLKPRYTINTLIGGFSGAIGPLIAESAAIGSITYYGIFLFLLLFLWQPPHFWALSIFRKEDYEKAQLAMLPVIKGIDFTLKQMILYFLLFISVIILGNYFKLISWIFSIPTIAFTIYIIYKIKLFKKTEDLILIRNIFFLTIFQNIIWHILLVIENIILYY